MGNQLDLFGVRWWKLKVNPNLQFIIFDKSCQLKEHKDKHYNNDENTSDLIFLIDKFHLNNHTRSKCHKFHNISNHEELKGLNSQICEQTFRLVSRHKHCSKHFTKNHFFFYFFCLFETMNKIRMEEILNTN